VIDPINGAAHPTTFAYDIMNRLTGITYPDGSSISFGYDYLGRRTSVTDQNQKTTIYAYDDADRLTSTTDPANHTTNYGYDTEGNLTSITDANNHTTNFEYNARGWVTQTTFPSTLYETYGYDAVGNLSAKTDRKNQTIQYVYDALNRLTQKNYPDSTSVDYVYDLVGKIRQVSDPTGVYGFAYDNMGRLIGTTTQYSFLSGQTFTNAYTYDAASNRKSLTAPDGSITTYGYDSLNRLNGLANSWAGSFGFGYDALSRRTSLMRPNGVNTSYSYDSVSHLLSVLHQAGTSVVDGASYTYDPAGNRTSKTNYLNGVTENYTYDPLYELTQVTQAGSTTESYSYDSIGNRLSSLGMPSYQYNASNELTSTSLGTYTYDNNGNTLTDAQGRSFSWDFENRLTQAINPGMGTTTFRYDPFGRRIQKSGSLGTTNYLYDGPNLAEETDASGNLLALSTQGQGIDQTLSEVRSGTVSYYNADGLGSVTSLTNSAASVVGTYAYDSFGNITTSTGTVVNPIRYTGREFDSETGIYYYRARFYDASAGRFVSEDPNRFFAGQNFYGYVKNQSPNLIDAFGLAGSHPGSIDGAWNQARMLLSDPDCAKFLKDLLVSLKFTPDLDTFLSNFDNTNFGFTPANDPFPNPDDYMAHVDSIEYLGGNTDVHVSPWAARPSDCCKLGVTLLHEVVHTSPYGATDFEMAVAVGYQGPNKVKPASRYFSKAMESHCVKACQK
jgi:RHS repeat-associated protein